MARDRENRIRARAYRIWEGEGRPEGRALVHWLQAESELQQRGARRARGAGDEPPPARKPRSRPRAL